jgi:hypothetical protein
MQAVFRRKLQRLTDRSRVEYVSPFTFALVYARIGDREQAIASLERAVHVRSPELMAWHLYPELEALGRDQQVLHTFAGAGLPVQ